jgi:hypothetical protein
MDTDPLAGVEEPEPPRGDPAAARLNTWVAITVALLATFAGICKVKDDNLVQAMQQAQADKLDHWAFYQARNIREEIAKATLAELRIAAPSSGSRAQAESTVIRYQALVADQEAKKDSVRLQAQHDQANYDALNYRDDQFDLCDALLAIAIAMLAVTALTRLWALYWAALLPTAFGVLMGLAGLAGLHIHPEALVQLLS